MRILFIIDFSRQAALVDSKLDGLFRAVELSKTNHEVSLACLIDDDRQLDFLDRVLDAESRNRIKRFTLRKDTRQLAPGMMSQACLNAHTVLEWLKREQSNFDLVHAFDEDNCLYFAVLAKHLGLHFEALQFLLICRSPFLQARDRQQAPVDSFIDLAGIFMQRQSVELADHLIFNSEHIPDWYAGQVQGDLRARSLVLQPLVPEKYRATPAGETGQAVTCFTFLGDLKEPADVLFYLDAFKRLLRTAKQDGFAPQNLKIRFVSEAAASKPMQQSIANALNVDGVSWEVIRQPLLEFVESGVAANNCFLLSRQQVGPDLLGLVLLSRNSPVILFENSGFESCVDESSSALLVKAHPHHVSIAMCEWLKKERRPLKSCLDYQQLRQSCADWYQDLEATAEPAVETRPSQPLVSVCVAHFNRPVELKLALDSVAQQDYRNIEVIVVDDGSTDPAAIELLQNIDRIGCLFPIRVYSQPNLYLGASRNLAARHANGEYMLFMDDDNLARPGEVATLLQVAEYSQADILTCFADAFVDIEDIHRGEQLNRIVFSGADIASGLFRNPYGDSNCMVRKSSFDELGGFSEDYKIGRDDQEFFSRAIMKGYKLYVVPEALYWYKINTTRMRQTQFSQYAGLHRVARTYVNESGLAPQWLDIMRYAQGLSALRFGVSGKGLRKLTQNNRLRLVAYRYPRLYRWLQPLLRKLF